MLKPLNHHTPIKCHFLQETAICINKCMTIKQKPTFLDMINEKVVSNKVAFKQQYQACRSEGPGAMLSPNFCRSVNPILFFCGFLGRYFWILFNAILTQQALDRSFHSKSQNSEPNLDKMNIQGRNWRVGSYPPSFWQNIRRRRTGVVRRITTCPLGNAVWHYHNS